MPEYFDMIDEPIDLNIISNRIKDNNYYRNKEMLYRDLCLMISNCKLFNADDTEYHITAVKLQHEIYDLFPDVYTYMQHNAKVIDIVNQEKMQKIEETV